ncbi:MAG: hypothetical protein LAP87_23660, partial [Acidobacteriia bacterium]|nr:hypothetical protein [Terriglobia bacterium]
PLDLMLQFFAAGLVDLVGVSMAIRCGPLFCCPAASGSRTHPQYVKRFGAICPAKSMAVPELLQSSWTSGCAVW